MAPNPEQIESGQELNEYLWSLYEGVFDHKAMEAHIRDYVGFTFADQMAPQVARRLEPGAKVLDLGCGFGAFVIAARRLGLDAYGVELAEFEVDYARKRLAAEFPSVDATRVFLAGDAQRLPYEDADFDAVTMWNVLEHVPDIDRMLAEAKRVLKPGGIMFIICPNYGALAPEAHYLVPWPPFLPKRLGPAWLRLWSKNPAYLEGGIFPLTNRQVLRALARQELYVSDLDKSPPAPRGLVARERLAKLDDPASIHDPSTRAKLTKLQKMRLVPLLKLTLTVQAAAGRLLTGAHEAWTLARRHNPMKRTVCLWARKGEVQ